MKYETHINAPETLKSYSLEKLVSLWEATTETPFSLDLAIVRGWLMDEIESRNPDGFGAWLDRDAPEDTDLRKYIFQPLRTY